MARVDGSAGWCLGPGNVSGLFAAYLPETAAREIYRLDWAMNGAESVAGAGRAVPVDDGYRLSGRWSFCTNSYGCHWYLGVFSMIEDGEVRRLPNGAPELWVFSFPADTAEVLPTWDTGGLRGTASNDLLLREAIVSEDFGYPMSAKSWAAAPMYAAGSRLWSQTAFAAVPLGIAQAAVDALVEIAKERIPAQGTAPLRDKPVLRDELGRAEAALRAAEALFHQEVAHCSAELNRCRSVTELEVGRLGQACSHLADTSREVVQSMYRLGGGASVSELSARPLPQGCPSRNPACFHRSKTL
jgi:indole-3-acetate monooxygenase